MLVHRRVPPSSKFAGTHLYTWVERGTVRVKCLAQEHNTVPRPRLEPRPLDPESSALTIRPPRHPAPYQSTSLTNCPTPQESIARRLKSLHPKLSHVVHEKNNIIRSNIWVQPQVLLLTRTGVSFTRRLSVKISLF